MRDNEEIATALDIASARARQLAGDVRAGRLWNRDALLNGIGEIYEQLHRAKAEAERGHG